jgi:hypothetical protein
MNKCPLYGINCFYALSEDSPLPCFATIDQCNDLIKKLTTPKEKLEEIKTKRVNNAIQELELEDI